MEMEAFNTNHPITYTTTTTTTATGLHSFTVPSSSNSIITSIGGNPTSHDRVMPGSAYGRCDYHHHQTPWMDSRIWSRLPQRLIDRVLAFLPLPAFFRARSVCKRWYSLLFSTHFLHLHLHLSPRLPAFLFFLRRRPSAAAAADVKSSASAAGGFLFDPVNLTWYHLSFPSIPPGFSPAAASGGLLCWVSDQAGPKTLVLFNPMAPMGCPGLVHQLPPTVRPRLFPSVGLAVTQASIDVAVAGDDLTSPYAVKNLTAEAFHIDAGGFYSIWGTGSDLPRLCSLDSGRMVHVGATFYCMNYSPFSVLRYDMASNEWCKIQAPMRRFLRSPSLVEGGGGQLLLVAAVEKSKLNVPRSLRVWTLQGGGGGASAASAGVWAEVERMPLHLYAEFAAVEGGRGFECVGHGDFVVVVVRGAVDKAVLYDFGNKRWRWIPPCPFVAGVFGGQNGNGEELHGYAYEPRLATPVTGLLDQLALPFPTFTA